MKNYILSCGSAVDLSLEKLKEKNIDWVPFLFYIDGKEYEDDLGQTVTYETFYKKIKNGAITRTSQINENKFVEHYEKFFKRGLDIICVCLSSGISGTYNSALIAKEELEMKYPERKMYVIDSLGASSGYGLLMDILADERDNGADAEEIVEKAENLKLSIQHLFFSTDFTAYVRGGRVSKTMALIGTILKICPILYVDKDGKLVQYRKVRTKKKAIVQIVNEMYKLCNENNEYDGKCFISHSYCYNDALEIKKHVENVFPKLKDKIKIFSIGTTIGSHTGIGTCALFFVGNKRS